MKLVSARFSDDVIARLDRLAKLTGRTKTFYMTEAVKTHLDDLEDFFLAEQRLSEFRASKAEAAPLEDVMKH